MSPVTSAVVARNSHMDETTGELVTDRVTVRVVDSEAGLAGYAAAADEAGAETLATQRLEQAKAERERSNDPDLIEQQARELFAREIERARVLRQTQGSNGRERS